MATYQEQIAKAEKRKQEKSFERVARSLVDALLPYIVNGKLTEQEASDIIVSFIKNLNQTLTEEKPK